MRSVPTSSIVPSLLSVFTFLITIHSGKKNSKLPESEASEAIRSPRSAIDAGNCTTKSGVPEIQSILARDAGALPGRALAAAPWLWAGGVGGDDGDAECSGGGGSGSADGVFSVLPDGFGRDDVLQPNGATRTSPTASTEGPAHATWVQYHMIDGHLIWSFLSKFESIACQEDAVHPLNREEVRDALAAYHYPLSLIPPEPAREVANLESLDSAHRRLVVLRGEVHEVPELGEGEAGPRLLWAQSPDHFLWC